MNKSTLCHKSSSAVTVSLLLCIDRVTPFFFDTFSSIFYQTLLPNQVIVIINGSSRDYIFDLIKSQYCLSQYPSLLLQKTPLRTLHACLNLGLHLCTSKYIARMDIDDVSLPHRLESQVEFIRLNPNTTVLGSSYCTISDDNSVLSRFSLPINHSDIYNALYFTNPFCHPSVVFNCASVLACGGYPSFLYCEDYALWLKLSRFKDTKFSNLPDSLLLYRSSSAGMARKNIIAYKSLAIAFLDQFLFTLNPLWLFAIIIVSLKIIYHSMLPKFC